MGLLDRCPPGTWRSLENAQPNSHYTAHPVEKTLEP